MDGGGGADYKNLRLLKAGFDGAGKSAVIRAVTDLVRNLLGVGGASNVFAPTGISAFQVVGAAGPIRAPTGKKAFGQRDPLKGDALRDAQENLRLRALLVGDERWMIGRCIMRWV